MEVKFQVKMIKNGDHDDWSKTMFLFANKSISIEGIQQLCKTLENTYTDA